MDVADAAGTRSSADTQEKSKTFISYSRRDGLDFVEQLTSGLELTGFEPTVDRHSIAGGEDWRARIGGLIADADSVVFVITPESVSSEICEWEIVRSVQLGKRLIPVVPLPMADTPVPKRLLNLNQIFFYPEASVPGSGFGKGLAELCDSSGLIWIGSDPIPDMASARRNGSPETRRRTASSRVATSRLRRLGWPSGNPTPPKLPTIFVPSFARVSRPRPTVTTPKKAAEGEGRNAPEDRGGAAREGQGAAESQLVSRRRHRCLAAVCGNQRLELD